MKKKKVILLVGISGSGKSTFVQEYCRRTFESVIVCSADDGHMVDVAIDDAGCVRKEYRFDPSKIGQAHSDCLNKYILAFCAHDIDAIIVDNTNLTKWERQNYFEIAAAFDVGVEVHQVDVRTIEGLKTCIARNVHNVPAATIADMALRFERVEKDEHYSITSIKDYLL